MIKIKVKQRRKIIILLLIVNVLSIQKSRKMNKLFLIIPEVLFFFFLPNMKTIMKREKHGESQKSQEMIIIIAWEDIFSLF